MDDQAKKAVEAVEGTLLKKSVDATMEVVNPALTQLREEHKSDIERMSEQIDSLVKKEQAKVDLMPKEKAYSRNIEIDIARVMSAVSKGKNMSDVSEELRVLSISGNENGEEYLLCEEWATGIIDDVCKQSPIVGLVGRERLTTNKQLSRVLTRKLILKPVEECGAKPLTLPAFSKFENIVAKVAGIVPWCDEMDDGCITDLVSLFRQMFTEALTDHLEYVILHGNVEATQVGEQCLPAGIIGVINATAQNGFDPTGGYINEGIQTAEVAFAGKGSIDYCTGIEILAKQGCCCPNSAVFVNCQTFHIHFRGLTDANGTPIDDKITEFTGGRYYWHGLPVYFTSALPALPAGATPTPGTTYAVIGDFSQVSLLIRDELSFAQSDVATVVTDTGEILSGFQNNVNFLRAEARYGVKIRKPDCFIKLVHPEEKK